VANCCIAVADLNILSFDDAGTLSLFFGLNSLRESTLSLAVSFQTELE
jgi:hypothetical protein